ncbi:hypothetical protein DFH06DRAFT_1185164, partial [Mycena polygramma]
KEHWLVRKMSASAGAVLSLGSLTTLLNCLKSLPRSLLRREASVPLSRDSVYTHVGLFLSLATPRTFLFWIQTLLDATHWHRLASRSYCPSYVYWSLSRRAAL